MGVDHVEWKAICTAFYKDGDGHAKEAVAEFEMTLVMGVGSMGFAADSPAMRLLRNCGMNLGNLSPDDLAACVATKNAARSEVHALLEQARRERLIAIIARHDKAATLSQAIGGFQSGDRSGGACRGLQDPPSVAAPFSTVEAATKMQAALLHFIFRYSADPASWPFLKGVVALLNRQHRHPTVLRWIVRGEDLTERGFPSFMEDAVPLLMGYFRYVPHFDEESGGGEGRKDRERGSMLAVSRRGVPISCHAWDVEHSLSDRQLARINGALQTVRSFDTSTSGSVVDTGIPRTNQGGALDEAERAICPLCSLL
jgi:hypothetical protein